MIKIELLEEKHLIDRVKMLNDPQVSQYLNISENFTIEKTIEWYKKRDTSKRYDYTFIYDNSVIGMGGITNISNINSNAELYMYLSVEFQGKGLGFESLIELCRIGLFSLNIHKIYLYTFLFNVRANKMYEKAGFKQEGILREHTYKDGILHDRCIYGLLKSEFKYL